MDLDIKTMPKSLQTLINKNSDKICACSNETAFGDGFFIILNEKYEYDGHHTVHEWRVTDMLREFKRVQKIIN